MKKFLNIIVIVLIISSCNNSAEKKNILFEYLKQSEIQYENDEQKHNIMITLNDILSLSSDELKSKKYPNYSNQINTWDLPKVIEQYFIPNSDTLQFKEEFYSNIKTNEVQEIIKDFALYLKKDNKNTDFENLGTFGDFKSQLNLLLDSGGIKNVVNWTKNHLKKTLGLSLYIMIKRDQKKM